MLEVLFGESGAACMEIAIEKGVISGSSEKVICLALMLDIGDIKEKIDSSYRHNLIFDMYTQNGYDNDEDTLKELKKAGKYYTDEYKRLINYVLNGEAIRIWYSNAPYEMCGFYYICDLLKDIGTEIFAIKLPDYIKIDDIVVSFQSLEEVGPEQYKTLINYQRRISEIELKMFSNAWLMLVEENSALRVVVNGRLIGVCEDFYDNLIYKHIGYEPIKEVRLIGNILGFYQLGVKDWWYASRIDCMIENNKIKVIEDHDNKYERIISKL
ncbi:hypothetical protein A500_18047 [Clostridium sartagoforme AAU1]|uniref:DUF1835 domain-containing protein n=1 Tax=Clostridium sartagoforme AAU1 TaxID=1202534 RepID=R9BT91_9CLOT|nr:DUF3658 domain-containing protein [Clostridium sartagoforme]EOR20232.1 hypothetical protein A500_18047 [Clostridium sartagoforme AAU1]